MRSNTDFNKRGYNEWRFAPVTEERILEEGLLYAGFDHARQNVSHETSMLRFKGFYGSSPIVCKKIWNEFQTTPVVNARIERKQLRLDYFLMSMYFLKCYPTELQLSGMFKVSEKTARRWIRFYLQKIQALKSQKVCR